MEKRNHSLIALLIDLYRANGLDTVVTIGVIWWRYSGRPLRARCLRHGQNRQASKDTSTKERCRSGILSKYYSRFDQYASSEARGEAVECVQEGYLVEDEVEVKRV